MNYSQYLTFLNLCNCWKWNPKLPHPLINAWWHYTLFSTKSNVYITCVHCMADMLNQQPEVVVPQVTPLKFHTGVIRHTRSISYTLAHSHEETYRRVVIAVTPRAEMPTAHDHICPLCRVGTEKIRYQCANSSWEEVSVTLCNCYFIKQRGVHNIYI